MTDLDPKPISIYKLMFFALTLAIVAVAVAREFALSMRPEPLPLPVVADGPEEPIRYRTTWCPSPEDRAAMDEPGPSVESEVGP